MSAAELQRIADLEAELEAAIAYMSSLPIVPKTYEAVARARAVLNKDSNKAVYAGTLFDGVPLQTVPIAVRFQGGKVTIKMPHHDMPPSILAMLKEFTFEQLHAGIDIPLLPIAESGVGEIFGHSFFPQALTEQVAPIDRRTGVRFGASGTLLLAVQIEGNIVRVSTGDFSNVPHYARQHQQRLYKELVRGVQLALSPAQ